tara:strand:+ start:9503 stop:10291 length:789 start_codon:yes stop_codon:yes gene_type:complete
MRHELALFAGAGGGLLAGRLLGWRTICAVEIDSYCRRVLLQRQRDGILERFPIWDDVKTFDGTRWKGSVDVISGGFPCQDISCAGTGKGLQGERSGLWSEMARIISEIRPPFVFVENSPVLVSRGLDIILSDFAKMGYDAAWCVIGAHHVGAPHKRDRIWILASYTIDLGVRIQQVSITKCQTKAKSWLYGKAQSVAKPEHSHFEQRCEENRWWSSESKLDRVVDGMANRMDRIKAIGNGQVPAVAALAWNTLQGMLNRGEQ